MRSRLAAVAATIVATSTVVATSLAAAATDPRQAPVASTPTTTLPGTPPQFDPLALFADVFARVETDPRDLGDLSQRVVPGSPAYAFLTYLAGFATARLDSRHGPLEPSTAAPLESENGRIETLEVCTSAGSCDVFGPFTTADGRLQTFLLNGVAIDDRVARPSKSTSFGPISVRVVGGFERVNIDQLALVVAIAATDAVPAQWEEVVYVDPSGAEIPVDLSASAYPADIEAGGEQHVVVQFPTADLGGDLVLPFAETDAAAPTQVVARVEVDALQP